MTKVELINKLKDIRAVLSDTEVAPTYEMNLATYNRYREFLDSSRNFILAINTTRKQLTALIRQLEIEQEEIT